MHIYVFGNGNISFDDFKTFYEQPLSRILAGEKNVEFLLCDFRGTDTLTMEFLKSKTSNVKVFHVGEKPRYYPDKFKTEAGSWTLVGGFSSDEERDEAAINSCTHFLGKDFNSDDKRKSGTQKNIEQCLLAGKMKIS